MDTRLAHSEIPLSQSPLPRWGLIATGCLLPCWLCLTTVVVASLTSRLNSQVTGIANGVPVIGLTAALWALALLITLRLMRRARWCKLRSFGLGLVLAAAYALAAAAIRTLAGEEGMLEAGLRLAGLTPLCLLSCAWVLRRGGFHRTQIVVLGGLSLPGVTGMATGAMAVGLLTIGWPLSGALGDVVTSLGILLQTLAIVLPEELLFRGMILGWLLRKFSRQSMAVALSLAAYTVFLPTMILPDANWDQLVWLVVLLPLALLTTQLRLLTGSVWAGVLVAWLFRVMPSLFTDPRDELMEPTQALSWAGMVLGALLLTAMLRLVRHLSSGRGARLRPLALALSIALAMATWIVWAGAWVRAGVPGFHNDGFIIIMDRQADLGPADVIRDPLARREYVYRALVAAAEESQPPIRARLEAAGLAYESYYLQNVIRVEGHAWRRHEFAGLPGVATVIVNPDVRPYPVHSQPPGILTDDGGQTGGDVQWNLRQVNADAVWEMGFRGEGVVVAGQDSGYDWQHPALRRSYRGWDESAGQADHTYNWHDVWDERAEPFDEDGHGTHTMGIIVGDDGDGNRIGVAPGARWIGCRNMRRGIGNPTSYLECMQFFLAPYPPGGDPFRDGDVARSPDVVNNSWGCPHTEGCQDDTLQGAVEALRAAGILTVASAGNDGPGCGTIVDPIARYDGALTVGAANRGGSMAYFSSLGPVPDGPGGTLLKPDLVAPGDDVRSSAPGDSYGTASGTSMAGPHVVGVIALLWSARPDLIGDIETAEDILRRSADPVEVTHPCDRPAGRREKRGLVTEIVEAIATMDSVPVCACGGVSGVPNNVYGWGHVDARSAVAMALRE
jgi:hypothetical protein